MNWRTAGHNEKRQDEREAEKVQTPAIRAASPPDKDNKQLSQHAKRKHAMPLKAKEINKQVHQRQNSVLLATLTRSILKSQDSVVASRK